MEVLFVTKPVKLVREAKTLKIIDDITRKIPIRIISAVFLFGNVDGILLVEITCK